MNRYNFSLFDFWASYSKSPLFITPLGAKLHGLWIFLLTAMLFSTNPVSAQIKEVALPRSGLHILSVNLGEPLLKQCSRSTPSKISAYWKPSVAEISKLEVLLPAYLQEHADDYKHVQKIVYHRQYMGIVVKGKRLIYGNFYPANFSSSNEQRNPVIICDGGASFWGVVFDSKTSHLVELKFNGEA